MVNHRFRGAWTTVFSNTTSLPLKNYKCPTGNIEFCELFLFCAICFTKIKTRSSYVAVAAMPSTGVAPAWISKIWPTSVSFCCHTFWLGHTTTLSDCSTIKIYNIGLHFSPPTILLCRNGKRGTGGRSISVFTCLFFRAMWLPCLYLVNYTLFRLRLCDSWRLLPLTYISLQNWICIQFSFPLNFIALFVLLSYIEFWTHFPERLSLWSVKSALWKQIHVESFTSPLPTLQQLGPA